MQSKAKTVDEYIDELPPDRKPVIAALLNKLRIIKMKSQANK